jgi:hypothetical protein
MRCWGSRSSHYRLGRAEPCTAPLCSRSLRRTCMSSEPLPSRCSFITASAARGYPRCARATVAAASRPGCDCGHGLCSLTWCIRSTLRAAGDRETRCLLHGPSCATEPPRDRGRGPKGIGSGLHAHLQSVACRGAGAARGRLGSVGGPRRIATAQASRVPCDREVAHGPAPRRRAVP